MIYLKIDYYEIRVNMVFFNSSPVGEIVTTSTSSRGYMSYVNIEMYRGYEPCCLDVLIKSRCYDCVTNRKHIRNS